MLREFGSIWGIQSEKQPLEVTMVNMKPDDSIEDIARELRPQRVLIWGEERAVEYVGLWCFRLPSGNVPNFYWWLWI